jgi:hypothetical protein
MAHDFRLFGEEFHYDVEVARVRRFVIALDDRLPVGCLSAATQERPRAEPHDQG